MKELVENGCKWKNKVLNLIHEPVNRFQSRNELIQVYLKETRSRFLGLNEL
jgi:hypothetical protein